MSVLDTGPLVFERGDKLFVVSKVVQPFTPSGDEMAELAFSTQVKKTAPNENIRWLKGQYVEADNPNRNNAHWTAKELALKSLTPMLMPVTVMHDPRTAVGTIADVKLMTPEKDGVRRARIDNVLALWAHRFPEVMDEVDANVEQGTLMESMEAFTPWYECSACSQVFHKQPHGAERALWCEHLKLGQELAASGIAPQEHQTVGWRTLGDVCFTGTGLIFGTRGAAGAYDEAHLADFQDELAEFHHRVHTDTAKPARSHRMGLVQIEESELAVLRSERDQARTDASSLATEKAARAEAERKVEETEAKLTTANQERDAARQEKADLEEQANQQTLAKGRLTKLGEGFKSKLGEFTRGRLEEQAKTFSDEEWDNRLKELEETASVKRDAAKDGATPPAGDNGSGNGSSEFTQEEIARLGALGGNGQPTQTGSGDQQDNAARQSVAAGLSKAFGNKR